MDRKEIKDAYKRHRPDMGVFVFRCLDTGTAYLGYGQDVKADINSLTFRLNLGSLSSKCGLQCEWTRYGAARFEVEVVELLEYDKDESKTDYGTDLKTLCEMCAERFGRFEFIQQ